MTLYAWQTAFFHQLTDTFTKGRGHHAQLFRTESGIGTPQLAHHFAHFLLCQHRQPHAPCGQCKSCLLFQTQNHPDFHLIAPIDGKAIGIDQIRETTAKLQQYAQQNGNIVVLIEQAEMLTEASANALLKSLEEPNENVYFLLVADMQSALLATIQSRCQTWLLPAPAPEISRQWLAQECPESTPEDQMLALRLAHFRPEAGKILLKNTRLPVRLDFLRTFWQFYQRHDVLLMLRAFEAEKAGALEQLGWLESFFADALKAKLNITQHWTNADLAHNAIVPFSQAFSPQKLLKGQQIIQRTARDLREITAVNLELMLLDGIIQLLLTVFEDTDEPR